MEIKKGDEFLELTTGVIFKIYFMSKHKMMCNIASRANREDGQEWILHTTHVKIDDIRLRIERGDWIPNTPAGRTLYGFKERDST